MLETDTVTLPIQVNGKKRGEIAVAKDLGKDAIEAAVLADPKIASYLDGKPVKKMIVVPGRIVNVVV